ncbi:hypothetical protein D9M68_794780 [compost metagenome]
MTLAQRPPGLFGGQRRSHRRPVVQRFGRQHLVQRRQSRLVAEQMAQGDLLLTGRGELRPIAGNRRIQFQLALANQLQGGDGGERLGTGKQVEDGVAVPGLLAFLVGATGPDIQHGLATDLHTECHSALLRVVEQGGESFFQRFELEIEITLYLHRSAPL